MLYYIHPGSKGEWGAVGDFGSEGEKGEQGDNGLKGEAGIPSTVKGLNDMNLSVL